MEVWNSNPLSFSSSPASWLLKVLLCITYTPTFDLNGSAVLKIAEVSTPSPRPSRCLFVLSAPSCFTPRGEKCGGGAELQQWGEPFSDWSLLWGIFTKELICGKQAMWATPSVLCMLWFAWLEALTMEITVLVLLTLLYLGITLTSSPKINWRGFDLF